MTKTGKYAILPMKILWVQTSAVCILFAPSRLERKVIRMRFKRFLPALLCLLLIVVICLTAVTLSGCSGSSPEEGSSGLLSDPDSSEDADTSPKVGTRVAYLPLDNRPVNQERVIYLAQAIGLELVMPEEHLYRTALDSMEPNPNGETLGDRAALLAWLREMDQTCDAFVISLDQALSGGLVGSRWLDNTDLSFEYEILDEIVRLCENNTVILFDTVMRLASTSGYQGLGSETYNELRAYGQKARKRLRGSELTIENIIAGYRYDANGQTISFSQGEEVLSRYLASRERKLRLADYLLRNAGDKMEFLYIGVDDSSPQATIQTNEINYLTSLLGEKGVLSAATDELGLCCLTRMATLLYGSPQLRLSYYGPGKNQPADNYDIGTLESMMDTHLICLNVTETDDTKNALQVLVLTRGSSYSDRQDLLEQAEKNLRDGIPTMLIDVSLSASELSDMMFYESDLPIGELLGYSSWNTAANAVGIALSVGVSRYAYLSSVQESTEEANEGFLKCMAFAYIKDISYKQFHASIDGIQSENYTCSVPLVLRRLNESAIVTSLSPYGKSSHAAVKASNFRYPWNRTFEMTFDIRIN